LLNGNYLTIAVSQPFGGVVGEHNGKVQRGQHQRAYLIETTDGYFHKKDGENVIQIHAEVHSIVWKKSKNANFTRKIEELEALLDFMLDRDKYRLSNGNYLTIFEKAASEKWTELTSKLLIVETTDGDFNGEQQGNFVKIHAEVSVYRDRKKALVSAHSLQVRFLAEDARTAIFRARRAEKARAARRAKAA
jgi:hypothetical protein